MSRDRPADIPIDVRPDTITPPCLKCDFIAATYADQIAAGQTYRCSDCGRAVAGNAAGEAPVLTTSWEAAQLHADDVRGKAFWVAAVVTLLLAPSPTLLTMLVGKPRAGLEEFVTIWNVFWHTLPLTAAAAVDAGILMWYARHPDQYPHTSEGKTTLWCCLGGVLFGSMLLGGWLGKVEMSAWSQTQVAELEAVQKRVDPSGGLTRVVARGSAKHLARNKGAWQFAVAAGALAAVANYFTLYGPALFVSSLAVGAFLGWVWVVKLPEVWDDVAGVGTAACH